MPSSISAKVRIKALVPARLRSARGSWRRGCGASACAKKAVQLYRRKMRRKEQDDDPGPCLLLAVGRMDVLDALLGLFHAA